MLRDKVVIILTLRCMWGSPLRNICRRMLQPIIVADGLGSPPGSSAGELIFPSDNNMEGRVLACRDVNRDPSINTKVWCSSSGDFSLNHCYPSFAALYLSPKLTHSSNRHPHDQDDVQVSCLPARAEVSQNHMMLITDAGSKLPTQHWCGCQPRSRGQWLQDDHSAPNFHLRRIRNCHGTAPSTLSTGLIQIEP